MESWRSNKYRDTGESEEFDYLASRLRLIEQLNVELQNHLRRLLCIYPAYWKDRRKVPVEIRQYIREGFLQSITGWLDMKHATEYESSMNVKQLREKRNVAIRQEFAKGHRKKDLSLKYGLSETMIDKIVMNPRSQYMEA